MAGTENRAQNGSIGIVTPRSLTSQFCAEFLDMKRCREWILKTIHPHGPVCPACGARVKDQKRIDRFFSGGRIRCPQCEKFFSAISGTFMSGTHRDYREMVLLMLLLSCDVEDKRIAAVLGEHPESIRIWRRKFEILEVMEVME